MNLAHFYSKPNSHSNYYHETDCCYLHFFQMLHWRTVGVFSDYEDLRADGYHCIPSEKLYIIFKHKYLIENFDKHQLKSHLFSYLPQMRSWHTKIQHLNTMLESKGARLYLLLLTYYITYHLRLTNYINKILLDFLQRCFNFRKGITLREDMEIRKLPKKITWHSPILAQQKISINKYTVKKENAHREILRAQIQNNWMQQLQKR